MRSLQSKDQDLKLVEEMFSFSYHFGQIHGWTDLLYTETMAFQQCCTPIIPIFPNACHAQMDSYECMD